MTFESKEWEYSNMSTETEFAQPEAGDQYLYIDSVAYDRDNARLDINFRSLANGAEFRVRYFMLTKNGNQNGFTGKVLRSLGKAINNEDKVLAPEDTVGAVVRAVVSFTVPKEEGGKSYPKIEEFFPVPKDLMDFSSKKDQYFEDDE